MDYLNGDHVAAFVSGCVSGAVFAWGFAQKTVVKYAIDRLEALEEECERRLNETKDIYDKTIQDQSERIERLSDRVRELEDSRLEIAMQKRGDNAQD